MILLVSLACIVFLLINWEVVVGLAFSALALIVGLLFLAGCALAALVFVFKMLGV